MYSSLNELFNFSGLINTNVYSGVKFDGNVIGQFFANQNKLTFESDVNEEYKKQISAAEKIATCVTCVKIIANTVARPPIKIYRLNKKGVKELAIDDYRYPLLAQQPNDNMSIYSFMNANEYIRGFKGNSYALKIYEKNGFKKGTIKTIELLPFDAIKNPKIVNGKLFWYLNTKKEDGIPDDDILHFFDTTRDGITGINPIAAVRLNVSTLYKAGVTVDSFYENNASVPKVLKSTIPDMGYYQKILESLDAFKKANAGPINAGNMPVLPPCSEIQELTLEPIDRKFIESNKYNKLDIAAFYGVPPDQIGVYEYTKFNNVEYKGLDFRSNTIAGITRMYRDEFERKLLTKEERLAGMTIEFDLKSLIELDVNTKMNYYKTMRDVAGASHNEVRIEENWPTYEGGDVHYYPSNNMTPADSSRNI